jgi:hypothetical protein
LRGVAASLVVPVANGADEVAAADDSAGRWVDDQPGDEGAALPVRPNDTFGVGELVVHEDHGPVILAKGPEPIRDADHLVAVAGGEVVDGEVSRDVDAGHHWPKVRLDRRGGSCTEAVAGRRLSDAG